MPNLRGLCAVALFVCLFSCQEAASEAPEPAAAEAAVPLPEAIAALGIKNVALPRPDLLTSAQLTPEQLLALKQLGYTTFISLRPASELATGWEEELAQQNGFRFVRIPVRGTDDITRENAARLDAALASAAPGPTALFCGSSNRVGALLAVAEHFIHGASPEQALALGRSAGLTRLEPAVRKELGLAE